MKTNIADIKDLPSVELGGGVFPLVIRRKQRRSHKEALLPEAYLGFAANIEQTDIARILTKSDDTAKHAELALRLHRNALEALCQAATEKASKAETDGKLGELSFAAYVAKAIVEVGNRVGGEMTDAEIYGDYEKNILAPYRAAKIKYERENGPESFKGSPAFTALQVKLCGSPEAFNEAVINGKAAFERIKAASLGDL